MRRPTAVLLVAAVLAAGLLAPPAAAEDAPASASIGISLVDGPTDDRGGLARDRISHVLAAGDDARWTVEVANTGAQPATVSVYAGGASLDGGRFRPDDDGGELFGWMSTDPSEVEVPADGEVEVSVDLEVPEDATGGDHAAVIWAATSSGDGDGSIERVSRIGLRALITVADGQPAAGFEIGGIRVDSAEDGTETLQVEVINTGGRMLEVAGDVDLHDGPGGVSAAELPLRPATIATGATATLATPLDADLPSGEWTAEVTVIGDHLSEEARATVTVGGGPAPPDGGDRGGDVRAALISLAAVLLLVTLIALLVAHRRDRDDDHVPEPDRQLAGV